VSADGQILVTGERRPGDSSSVTGDADPDEERGRVGCRAERRRLRVESGKLYVRDLANIFCLDVDRDRII